MSDNTPAPQSQIDIFPAPDGNIPVEVRFLDDTAWLSQKLMAERDFEELVKGIDRKP